MAPHKDQQEMARSRPSRAPLESIIESAMDAVISINSRQEIVLFNPAAERMFCTTAAEALGKNIAVFIPERFRHAHVHQVEQFGRTGETHRRMGRLGAVSGLRATGEEFPAEASISHAVVAGEMIYTVIMRDISERRAAELALQQAKADLERLVAERTAELRLMIAELQHFSYTIAHDMRAPLRALQGFSTILGEKLGSSPDPEVQDALRRIDASARRMDQLITDSLNYSLSGQQDFPLHPVNVVPFLRGIIESYPNLQPPGAEIIIREPIPLVVANEAALTQCFSNLLGNAVKFVPPGVRPKVEISSQVWPGSAGKSASPAPAPDTPAGDPARRVRIFIDDNGIGIAPEFRPRIFDMFQRESTKYEGTGVGLALVKKIVERIGGRVGYEPREGGGSRFWLDLKLSG